MIRDNREKLVVDIQDLLFSYHSGHPVLKIDKLEVKSHERIFLYGPSGCGKSTLLSILSGILVPDEGKVEVLGVNLKDVGHSQRDRLRGEKIGYIFQIFNLVPYLNVLENIILPCQICPERVSELKGNLRKIIERGRELAQSLGLEQLLDKNVADLSIGQQQRVAAARALMGNPKLVIADEPTSALDKKNTQEFMDLLMREWEAKKFALIFVSHDERLASSFDRVVSLPEINRCGSMELWA